MVPGATTWPPRPGPVCDPDPAVSTISAEPLTTGTTSIDPTSAAVMTPVVHMSLAVPVVGVAVSFSAGVVPATTVDAAACVTFVHAAGAVADACVQYVVTTARACSVPPVAALHSLRVRLVTAVAPTMRMPHTSQSRML